MKRKLKTHWRCVGILLLAIGCATASAPQHLARAQERQAPQTQSTISPQDSPLEYLLYLPPGVSKIEESLPRNFDQEKSAENKTVTKRWPLVLFLHGGGEGGDNIETVKKHGLPKLIAAGKEFPFIVVSPQNPSTTQFWDDQKLIRLLDNIETDYPVDPNRVYLTGMSRGGFGAWRLAIQNPNRFAALVPVCGGGALPYVGRLKSMPVWVFHGAKDTVIPINESQRLVKELKRVGGNVKFTIYPEARHDAWTETYANPAVVQWMLRQQR